MNFVVNAVVVTTVQWRRVCQHTFYVGYDSTRVLHGVADWECGFRNYSLVKCEIGDIATADIGLCVHWVNGE